MADHLDTNREELASLCRQRCLYLVKILPVNVASRAISSPGTATVAPPNPSWRSEPCDEPAYDRYQRVTVDDLTIGQSWLVRNGRHRQEQAPGKTTVGEGTARC